ncbi:MAG TPA: PIN domain-containing protein [Solirubrobacteraceae bacterium]|nr:PIN domain-containing protein [Solirubrobacteraceae bacterium]
MLIVDAGPLYAAAATDDDDHRRCVELLTTAEGPLLVPELVVCEVAYLLSDRIGPHAEVAFARALASGELIVEPVLDHEWTRVAELAEQYEDLPFGMADAALVALAERHGAKQIASLDHRHLGVVRPRHVTRFRLLP